MSLFVLDSIYLDQAKLHYCNANINVTVTKSRTTVQRPGSDHLGL